MKVSNSKLFPYPVLWFINDDYYDSDFGIEMVDRLQFKKLELEYKINLYNKELLSLIESGKALFCIHIENSITSFRYSYLTKSNIGTILIDEEDVNYQIDISTFIVANQDISHYRNEKLNNDYNGVKFDITKGSILAIADYISLNVDKSKNSLGKKDSIFNISKTSKEGPMEFEIMNDRIVIKLGEENFENLQRMQMSSKHREVIYSMFIVPALIYVFENLARSEDEDMEEYREYLWFRSLEKLLKAYEIELNHQTIKTKTSYILAQKLIGEPISKALVALNERSDFDENFYPST